MRMEGFGAKWHFGKRGVVGTFWCDVRFGESARFGTTWNLESEVTICMPKLIASGIYFFL